MKLAINTPIYQRFHITTLFLKYYHDILKPSLKAAGINPILFLAGNLEDLYTLSPELLYDIHFLNMPNVLGLKKNIMLTRSFELGVDFVCTIDSDDFFSSELILKLITLAEKNKHWSSVENFAFYNTADQNFYEFLGYSNRHPLYKAGMGSGRVFSRYLVSLLGEAPFKQNVNRGMDASIQHFLSSLRIASPDRLVNIDKNLPIGLKSHENIWSFDSYKTSPLAKEDPKVSWLPSCYYAPTKISQTP